MNEQMESTMENKSNMNDQYICIAYILKTASRVYKGLIEDLHRIGNMLYTDPSNINKEDFYKITDSCTLYLNRVLDAETIPEILVDQIREELSCLFSVRKDALDSNDADPEIVDDMEKETT